MIDTPAMGRRQAICLAAWLLAVATAAAETPATWRAGVAREKITPSEPMWMSGYASRDHEAEGTLTELWAKALALEDPAGARLVLLTVDLVGIDRHLSAEVCAAIQRQHGMSRAGLAIACSHTHTGPVVGHNLGSMYFLNERQRAQVQAYTAALQGKLVAIAGRALAELQPCTLHYGAGSATLAVNRRNNPEDKVPQLRADGQLRGPVDHDVPVLQVADADGRARAIVFGYACHATVLSSYQWSGDYPGFAQLELEARHPDVTALFWAGCGADQNPLPRRTVELAQDYGRQLADSVDAALAQPLRTIGGRLRTAYEEIDLPFAQLPTRPQLVEQSKSQDRYVASRGQMLLAQIDAGQALSPTYPYPVQTWHLGDGPRWVFLGGEVVVDYALRLKREQAAERMWVTGYANDVMAYVPSLRVLREGGYEGGGAMVYYGLPSPWAESVEEQIVSEVHSQIQGAGE